MRVLISGDHEVVMTGPLDLRYLKLTNSKQRRAKKHIQNLYNFYVIFLYYSSTPQLAAGRTVASLTFVLITFIFVSSSSHEMCFWIEICSGRDIEIAIALI